MPNPSANQIAYVQKGGNDGSGTGSITAPYLTISKAISTITDASPSKRYEINIGPGTYDESKNGINLPANVLFHGRHQNLTVVETSSLDLGSGFVQGNDDLVGLSDLSISNPGGSYTANFDFTGSSGPNTQGKLYITNTNVDQSITVAITGEQDLTTATIINSMINGNVSVNNLSAFEADQTHFLGNLTCSSLTGITFSTSTINLKTSVIDGNFTAQGDTGRHIDVIAINSTVGGNLVIDGPSSTLTASSDFFPIKSNSTFSNGSTITFNSDASGVGYTPSSPAHWIAQPATIQEALDNLAGNVQNLLVSSGSQVIDVISPLSGIGSYAANTPHMYSILGKTVQLVGQISATTDDDILSDTVYSFRVRPPAGITAGSWTSNISGQFSVTGLSSPMEIYNLILGLDANGVIITYTSTSSVFNGDSILVSYNVSFTLT